MALKFCKFYLTIKLTIEFRNFCGKKIPGPGSGFLSGFRFLYFWWSYQKIFPDLSPVFCPVSGFCTSDGPIEKFFMQVNFF